MYEVFQLCVPPRVARETRRFDRSQRAQCQTVLSPPRREINGRVEFEDAGRIGRGAAPSLRVSVSTSEGMGCNRDVSRTNFFKVVLTVSHKEYGKLTR